MPPFAASYIEYRIMKEPASGNPDLVSVRNIARDLCQESNLGDFMDKETIRKHVGTLSASSVLWSRLQIGEYCATEDIDYVGKSFAAAILLNAVTSVERHLEGGSLKYSVNLWPLSSTFNPYVRLAVEQGSCKVLQLLLSVQDFSFYGELDLDLSLIILDYLLAKAAGRGKLDIVQALYAFRSNISASCWVSVWNMKEQPRLALLTRVCKEALKTPNSEVFNFIMQIRRRHKLHTNRERKIYTQCIITSASEGWFTMTQKLLALGANPNGHGGLSPEERPISVASKAGHLEVVQLLLQHGVETQSAVAQAARNGHRVIVQTLLDHGADPKGGLGAAAAGGYLVIVRLLLDHGVQPDSRAESSPRHPLVSAVRLEHVTLFRLLLWRGATFSYQRARECGREGYTRHLESMARFLTAYGVGCECPVKNYGRWRYGVGCECYMSTYGR
jgi:hypothetical protein